jgi:hypothetical protein
VKLYPGPFESRSYTEVLEPPVNVDCTHTLVHNGVLTVNEKYLGRRGGATEEFSSLYTPNFHKLVDDGWVIQCPYLKVQTTWSHVGSTIVDDVWSGWNGANRDTHTYQNLCDYAQFPSSFYGPKSFHTQRIAAQDEVITRVFAKSQTRNADLLIDLSQIRQAINMFRTLANRLYILAKTPGTMLDVDGLIALLSGRGDKDLGRKVRAYPVAYPRLLKELSGLWCEMRFGWRPLLSSLDGIVKSLSDPNMGKEKRTTYRSMENVDLTDIQVKTRNDSPGGGLTSPAYFKTETRYEGTFKAGILLAERYDLAESLGLSVSHIPIAIWDLVPFSFIVDRFINVGSYIRSLRPIASVDFGGAWCVERFKSTHVFGSEYLATDQVYGAGTGQYVKWVRTGGWNEVRCETTGVIRTIVQRPPILPTVRWDWSSINDTFNAIDGIMLAIQRLVPLLGRIHRR